MSSGYTRQAAAQIASGLTVKSGSHNSEFDALEAAFDAVLGHTHDGSVGQGAPIAGLKDREFVIPLTDEATAMTAGYGKFTFRMPWAATLTAVRASLNSPSTSGAVVINIRRNGTTVFTAAKLQIDAGAKTSVGSSYPYSLATTALSDNDEVTFDVTSAGTGAIGCKVTLYMVRV
jgi:hypothetical protein